jgi:hypothetical protein
LISSLQKLMAQFYGGKTPLSDVLMEFLIVIFIASLM